MGRPAKVRDDELFAAVAHVLYESGPRGLTTRGIATAVGVPTGSLYHRFPTRDVLVARAWLDAVRVFQRGVLDALDQPDLDAAIVDAAAHTPRWAAANPAATALLLRYGRRELLEQWPVELDEELRQVNRPVEDALIRHSRLRWGRATKVQLDALRFALATIPRAAVRDHGHPEALATAVGAAALAAVRAVSPPDARASTGGRATGARDARSTTAASGSGVGARSRAR